MEWGWLGCGWGGLSGEVGGGLVLLEPRLIEEAYVAFCRPDFERANSSIWYTRAVRACLLALLCLLACLSVCFQFRRSCRVLLGGVRLGTVRMGAVRFGVVELGAVGLGVIRIGAVWLGAVGFGTVRLGAVLVGTVRFGAV